MKAADAGMRWRNNHVTTPLGHALAVGTNSAKKLVSTALTVLLIGAGTLQAADNSALRTMKRIQNGNTAARSFSAAGLANLTAFARLYGYVRYFHPSDESAGADWQPAECP